MGNSLRHVCVSAATSDSKEGIRLSAILQNNHPFQDSKAFLMTETFKSEKILVFEELNVCTLMIRLI